MAIEEELEKLEAKYIPTDHLFYRNHYAHILMFLMLMVVGVVVAAALVLYLVLNRPLPEFAAKNNGQVMQLTPYQEPNLQPQTILNWAGKAATIAYTLDFVNYNKQIAAARSYFTEAGWRDYVSSGNRLVSRVVADQLFVNGVVSGTAVISNQGEVPDKGYVWRVQIPFLVTYQSANITNKQKFMVTLSVVRVPTDINPQGIGIDQFVMR